MKPRFQSLTVGYDVDRGIARVYVAGPGGAEAFTMSLPLAQPESVSALVLAVTTAVAAGAAADAVGVGEVST